MNANRFDLGGGEPIITLRGIAKSYWREALEIPVLQGIDLEIPVGSFVALMGPSGSGKTTLLNLVAGIDRPTCGTLEVCGHELNDLDDDELAAWRNAHVGFIFQNSNLVPVLTAFENVEGLGCQERRGGPGPHGSPQRRHGQDHRDGHPRPQSRPPCAAPDPPREGRAGPGCRGEPVSRAGAAHASHGGSSSRSPRSGRVGAQDWMSCAIAGGHQIHLEKGVLDRAVEVNR